MCLAAMSRLVPDFCGHSTLALGMGQGGGHQGLPCRGDSLPVTVSPQVPAQQPPHPAPDPPGAAPAPKHAGGCPVGGQGSEELGREAKSAGL